MYGYLFPYLAPSVECSVQAEADILDSRSFQSAGRSMYLPDMSLYPSLPLLPSFFSSPRIFTITTISGHLRFPYIHLSNSKSISFTFACASMAFYIYPRALGRAMLSPDWRVRDETSPAVHRTPLNRHWRRPDAPNGFYVDENRPALTSHKMTNKNSFNREYEPRAARTLEERRSIGVGNLLPKNTKEDVDEFPTLAGYAV